MGWEKMGLAVMGTAWSRTTQSSAHAHRYTKLVPSRHAAQLMLQKCEQFCEENNIQFCEPQQEQGSLRGGAEGRRPAPVRAAAPLAGGAPRPHPPSGRANAAGLCREKRAQIIDSTFKIREGFGFAHLAKQITAVASVQTMVGFILLWSKIRPLKYSQITL